jgi:formylglycine-generating enzyme required for sulfatase activity
VGREQPKVPANEITNSIGMKLVLIPKGKFWMGSTEKEQDQAIADCRKIANFKVPGLRASYGAEGPLHMVEITKAFYLGMHEVTQAQYRTVMGKNPSSFSLEGDRKDQVKGMSTDYFPVDNVSYEDAMEFCKKLSELPEEKRAKRTYRLPREAEWEHACRGGAPSYQTFHFGNSLSSTQANFNGNFPFGKTAAKGPYLGRTEKVGSYKANAFGLYDMHGNVCEWCSDWYDKDNYRKIAPPDPQGPLKGSERVLRGGSWGNYGLLCRSAFRGRGAPTERRNFFGFRVALIVSGDR